MGLKLGLGPEASIARHGMRALLLFTVEGALVVGEVADRVAACTRLVRARVRVRVGVRGRVRVRVRARARARVGVRLRVVWCSEDVTTLVLRSKYSE